MDRKNCSLRVRSLFEDSAHGERYLTEALRAFTRRSARGGGMDRPRAYSRSAPPLPCLARRGRRLDDDGILVQPASRSKISRKRRGGRHAAGLGPADSSRAAELVDGGLVDQGPERRRPERHRRPGSSRTGAPSSTRSSSTVANSPERCRSPRAVTNAPSSATWRLRGGRQPYRRRRARNAPRGATLGVLPRRGKLPDNEEWCHNTR